MIVHNKPFDHSLLFSSKVGAYPSEVPFRYSTLKHTPGIRLDYKGLPGTNSLVYFEHQ